MRISPRYAPLIFALLMSLVMAFIMTGFVTWVNTGIDKGFTGRWMHSFIMAWPLAMACVLFFVTPVRSLVAKFTAP